MALLINKIFSSRKKIYNKHQDACERAFTFSEDQVRVILFRECDFRGRKLLFDSQSVQRILLPATTTPNQSQFSTASNTTSNIPNKNENYVEISNGYGYHYLRPNNDIVQFGDMVFGSVAMSFRGTSLKIHSFSQPAKLMCTQVFPSPRHPIRGRTSVTSQNFDALRSNNSINSFEKSCSSNTSFNEQVSLYSTESENKFTSGSVPLDVPASSPSMTNTKFAPSLEGDSGFCGEQSYSSVSSGPPSMSLWDTRHENASIHGFSCGSLYKRWLRSASTSLDYNGCSDNSLSAGVQSSASADECMTRGHHRSSKLGLAVIINLSNGQEIELERFLLEHSALIEAMVCRARAGAESAYIKPSNFASLMYDVYNETSQWLVDLITGPSLRVYMWHQLTRRSQFNKNECDNNTIKSDSMFKTKSESSLVKSIKNRMPDDERTRNLLLSSSLLEINNKSLGSSRQFITNELLVFNTKCDEKFVSKLRVNPKNFNTNDTSLNAEKFVRELCELLEAVDAKHTNFFISTLLTAVLTNHLGWVSSVLPPSKTDKETISNLNAPCNPLWGQLSDLYGAVGSPTKVAHTIICGNNKNGLITRILNILTYFIRCSIVERNTLKRYSSNDDNDEVDKICHKPKTTEKIYTYDPKPLQFQETQKTEELEMSTLNLSKYNEENLQKENKNFGLARTKSYLENLSTDGTTTTTEPKSIHPLLEKVTSLGLSATNSDKPIVFDHLIDIKEASNQFLKVFHTTKPIKLHKEISYSSLSKLAEDTEKNDSQMKDNKDPSVVFVLGDNEQLIGLKKNEEFIQKLNIPSCSQQQRPTDLKIPIRPSLFHCDSSDSSPNIEACRHLDNNTSSSDTSPCSDCEKNQRDIEIEKLKNSFFNNNNNNTKSTNNMNKIVLTHSSVIDFESEVSCNFEMKRRDDFNRSQSVPPSDKSQRKCSKNGCKRKYSGVKFDFKQYPEIVTNYMKCKNLEISQMSLLNEKSLKLNRSFSASFSDCSKFEFPSCDCKPLQTPSNASELEFTSELLVHGSKLESHRTREKFERKSKVSAKTTPGYNNAQNSSSRTFDEVVFEHPLQENKENNAIFEHEIDTYEKEQKAAVICDRMNCIELPMPRTSQQATKDSYVGYTKTLLRGVSDKYISDMVLQGTTSPLRTWETILRRDLSLAARKPLLDQPIQEAVAIVANTDTWEVQLISSHTFVVERGTSGIRVGMSQLIANMLESLLHMWKLRTPAEYCLMHIESRLRELCIRSKALAQLLMATEFCNMDFLTSTLQLEVNDVPLLMAVASTHTPQVTQKYGLSFQ